jgi:NitT/TauT family transport system substrate-binding protein
LKPTCPLFAALIVAILPQGEGLNPAQLAKPTQQLTKVRVIVPTRDNLQYMSFWVAKGAGYFRDENIQLILLIPPEPVLAKEMFIQKDAQVAVFSPPMYLELIAEQVPILLVANLLQNDPINLVVRRSVFDQRAMSLEAPIAERMRGLEGLRIGIAPNPPTRLRALFAQYGMDADRDVKIVTLRGREQNAGFDDDRVDALYAHTPYLERAIVDQDAVLLINQSAGEVPNLWLRQIHAVTFGRQFAEANPSIALSMTRAIYRAQQLIHSDPAAAVEALYTEFPSRNRQHLETIVRIYAPAVPESPDVSIDGLKPALSMFPATRRVPTLDGLDLSAFVAPQFAESVRKSK